MSSPQGLSDADRDALLALAPLWDDAQSAGDWETVASTITDDFTLVMPDQEPIEGKSQWLSFAGSFPPIKEVHTTFDDVGGSGDVAYLRGHSSFAMEVDGTLERNTSRFIAVARKQADGTWKLSQEIANFERPLTM